MQQTLSKIEVQIDRQQFLRKSRSRRANVHVIAAFVVMSVIVLFFSFHLHATAVLIQPLPAKINVVHDGCPLIEFGQLVTDSIDSAGASDCFSFSGILSDTVRVRVVKTAGELTADLDIINLADNKGVCSTIVGEISCVLKESGNYKIVVSDFGGTDTGNYNLFLQRLNAPVGCVPLTFGALPAVGTIESAAEIDCFTITGAILDQIRVRVVETSGSDFTGHFEVIRPDGSSLCSTVVGEKDCLLDETGQHTILIKNFAGANIGAYSLYIQRLNQPLSCSTIGFGALPTATQIEVPAEADCFTFSGVVSDTIRIRSIETNGQGFSTYFEIYRPDGTSLCGSIQPEENCMLDVDGEHLLLVQDFAGDKTGSYSLLIQRQNDPVGCVSFGFNGTQIGDIQVAADVDCYRFQSAGNGEITLNVTKESGTLSAFSEIIRPNGTTLCDTILEDLHCSLDMPGQHTILIKDFAGTITGTYQLNLLCLSGGCGTMATPTPTNTPQQPTPTRTPQPPTATPSATPLVVKHEQFLPLVTR